MPFAATARRGHPRDARAAKASGALVVLAGCERLRSANDELVAQWNHEGPQSEGRPGPAGGSPCDTRAALRRGLDTLTGLASGAPRS